MNLDNQIKKKSPLNVDFQSVDFAKGKIPFQVDEGHCVIEA